MARTLAELGRTSLREQALESLRAAISGGAIGPGARLVEVDLSTQLGISRGTLREALRQLQQDGLVESDGRGRLRVRALDDKEITDMFLVRGALEGLAAAMICEFASRDDAIDALGAALDTLAAQGATPSTQRIEADLDFHRTLVRASGNATLVHQWTQLEGSIRMSIMVANPERAVQNMDAERHREILDAVAAGKAEAAGRVVRKHMREASAALIGS